MKDCADPRRARPGGPRRLKSAPPATDVAGMHDALLFACAGSLAVAASRMLGTLLQSLAHDRQLTAIGATFGLAAIVGSGIYACLCLQA